MVSNKDDDGNDVDDEMNMTSTTYGYGYTIHKTDLKVQAHQSPTLGSLLVKKTLGSLADRHYEIEKVITHPSGVR